MPQDKPKNRYFFEITMLGSVEVEADTPEDAEAEAGFAAMKEYGSDVTIVAMRLTETIEDGPAKYEAWCAAMMAYQVACRDHGRDSPEAKAAEAYYLSLPTGV